jgi:protein-tyrosine sulfotransferase
MKYSQDKYNLKFQKYLPLLIKFSDHFFRRYPTDNQLSELSCESFFIIGSGRNGSTLVSAMMNQHRKIMIPPEQWILHEMIIKFKMLNFLEWKDLVNILLGLISNVRANEGWHTNFQTLYSKLYELPSKDRTLRKIIDEIYVHHGKERNVEFEIWGDKSPINTIYLEYILPAFPRSKYIFLVRDGRDVVSSIMKIQGFGLEYSVWRWNDSIKKYKYLQKKVQSSQLYLVKYEELVKTPKKTMEDLLKFLGLEYESSMANYRNSLNYLGVMKLNHHQNLQEDINKKGISAWEKRLSKNEKEILLPMIEKNLHYMKYI